MSAAAGRESRVVAGRYALTDVIGRGGMGVVWLADDHLLERRVALKELCFPADLTDDERGVLCERTRREARAAARLDHPCVIRVYDVVEEEGKPWLVMEHVPSRSLQQILEETGPLPPETVARIGLDVLEALDAAHAAGIVHRDVKPSNVVVDGQGHACLTDFGIATTTGDSSLTTGGALIGSPSYMAPERAHGDTPEPPVDLWSLGATLYTAVEGRPPFDRGEPMATLLSVVSEHPAPMLRAGPLEPVLRGLLAKDPARRTTAEQARPPLSAVAAGIAPPPSPPVAAAPVSVAGSPPPAAPPPQPVAPAAAAPAPPLDAVRHGNALTRFDADDLRRLAAASAAALGSVARDSAQQLTERRRVRRQLRNGAPPAAPPRWRFKRRWVVVPILVVLLLTILLVAGLILLLAAATGQL
jgi:serine/threonine protein kinase